MRHVAERCSEAIGRERSDRRGEKYEEKMIRDVFDWLERNGGVNYGVLTGKRRRKRGGKG